MKLTEELKTELAELIETSLNSARLKYYKDDEDGSLPLVDLLTTGDTIKEGEEEITNMVEQILFDMDEWEVKNLTIPAVSQQRELLIDFLSNKPMKHQHHLNDVGIKAYVDKFLKSIYSG